LEESLIFKGEAMLPGVYIARKKDHTPYYRGNITYRGKHISLGSFPTEPEAHCAYTDAAQLLAGALALEDAFEQITSLSYDKLVTLVNFRDNHMYISSPIYLRKNYFSYYLDIHQELKFDIDDLFYYSRHRILKRQGHLYVNDYGMQVTILSRYGIKSHAVCGRDYRFVNGDTSDFRYSNIEVINPYFGVSRITVRGQYRYRAQIHINGNYTVGTYRDEIHAAIAYNKAVDLAKQAGINKSFPQNYIEELSGREYADIYTAIKIAPKYLNYMNGLPG
jgi:hypothetical protein